MSDQNRSDWNDDLDFESLADEHEVDSDLPSVDEDLSDFEDGVYGSEDSSDVAAEDPAPEAVPDPLPSTMVIGRKGGVSGGWLGFMFGTAILVSALGLTSAVLIMTGTNPLSLWDPSGLTSFDQVINFQDHPQNLLYLMGVGVLLLTVLGSAAVSRSARATNKRLVRAENLLDKITALRLEDEDGWTSPDFKAESGSAAFVAEILGSWRMQLARLKRLVGLEGELQRLVKAVTDGTGNDLNGRFDNPSVGTLYDEFTRLLDEVATARKTSDEAVNKDAENSESAMGLLLDARTWNFATLDKLGVQGASLEQIAQKVGLLAAKVSQVSETEVGHQALLDELKTLQNQDTGDGLQGAADVAAELENLVEKGSKLAFQVAMEVTRLGQRGERLLPMTKALEELTTRFRQTATSLKAGCESGSAAASTGSSDLATIISRLEQAPRANWSELGHLAAELGPRAGSVSEGLVELADGFNGQDDRLSNLGSRLADLTGLEFNAQDLRAGRAENPPEGSLNLASSDPFAVNAPEEAAPAEVDPFLTGSIELPGNDSPPVANDFATSEPVARESIFGDSPVPEVAEQADPIPVVPAADMDIPREAPEASGFGSDAFGDIPLSGDEEKVYDLAEFDAVRIDDPVAGQQDTETDRIYDLSEFGAQRLG